MFLRNKKLHSLVLFGIIALIMTSCGSTKRGYKPRDNGYISDQNPVNQAIIESRNGNHDRAIDIMDKLLESNPSNPDLLVRKASFLYEANRKEEALDIFEKTIEASPDYDPELYYSAAFTAMDIYRYGKAQEYFTTYIQKQKENPEKVERAKKLLASSNFRNGLNNEQYNIDPQPLSGDVNTLHLEYLPALSLDQSRMIFTRRIAGQEDIYIADYDGEKWVNAREISGVNTAGNEGAHTISSDGKLIIFTACDRRMGYGGCDLFYTRLEEGKWNAPVVMDRNVNTHAWEAQPCLSADGNKLFFSSSRTGTYGVHDIYMCEKDQKGDWLPAKNLGPIINTAGNEESPYLHADGKTLYFRSNGHPGMGSHDLFKSTWDEKSKSWSKPINLGPPINTEGDEGALTISLDGKTAYYASDILTVNTATKNLDILTFEIPEYLRPEPVTFIKARVFDKSNGKRISVIANLTNESSSTSTTKIINEEEDVIFALPSNSDYNLTIDKKGYKYYLDIINLEESNSILEPIIIDVYLLPFEKITPQKESEPIILDHIYFSSGSADLLPQSFVEIQKLADMMKENPELKVKIIGHTDDVGSDSDNLLLSQNRAEAVVNALVTTGINSQRLTPIGKGESSPIADNSTEAGRSKNRRTEAIFMK